MPSSTPQLPSEFYKPSTLFTLGGSAGAVWLLCLVLGSFDPSNKVFTPLVFRIIALAFSLFISVLMFYRKKPEIIKLENYLLMALNGMLIFANASGFNAMSSKIAFESPETLKITKSDEEAGMFGTLAISLFGNEVFWWESEAQFIYYRDLRNENEALSTSLKKCEQSKSETVDSSDTNYEKIIDGLRIRNDRLRSAYQECKAQLASINNSENAPMFKGITEVLNELPNESKNQIIKWIHLKAERTIPSDFIKSVIINNRKVSIQEIRMLGKGRLEVYVKVVVPNGVLSSNNTVSVIADKPYDATFKEYFVD